MRMCCALSEKPMELQASKAARARATSERTASGVMSGTIASSESSRGSWVSIIPGPGAAFGAPGNACASLIAIQERYIADPNAQLSQIIGQLAGASCR